MPNAITMNTTTGAVSEYTGFAFQSLTATHAGAESGLFFLGGSADNGMPIVAQLTTGQRLLDSSLKKTVQMVYFSLLGSGTSTLTLAGKSGSYSYSFEVTADGQSRAKPGKGIRENYLAFGYSNADGADFQLDRIEALVAESKNRRI